MDHRENLTSPRIPRWREFRYCPPLFRGRNAAVDVARSRHAEITGYRIPKRGILILAFSIYFYAAHDRNSIPSDILFLPGVCHFLCNKYTRVWYCVSFNSETKKGWHYASLAFRNSTNYRRARQNTSVFPRMNFSMGFYQISRRIGPPCDDLKRYVRVARGCCSICMRIHYRALWTQMERAKNARTTSFSKGSEVIQIKHEAPASPESVGWWPT